MVHEMMREIRQSLDLTVWCESHIPAYSAERHAEFRPNSRLLKSVADHEQVCQQMNFGSKLFFGVLFDNLLS
jgi:hypothetical protein